MNGYGCKKCPVEKCETLIYRGSVCAAQRAKLGLGDPNDKTDCWQFQDCCYRNDVGGCPRVCGQYRHKDDVRVVRCKDCKRWVLSTNPARRGLGRCSQHVAMTCPDSYCSWGVMRNEEVVE